MNTSDLMTLEHLAKRLSEASGRPLERRRSKWHQQPGWVLPCLLVGSSISNEVGGGGNERD